MPADVTIIRRPVKHARLRVRETGQVEFVVPSAFTDGQAQEILRRKANWIDRQHNFFKRYQPLLQELTESQVPLFGNVYKFIPSRELGRKTVVDQKKKVIKSGIDLTKAEERRVWYRLFARQHLSLRVRRWSESCALPFNRLFILSQKTRWGNCSPKKNISLNWRLILAPEHVIDYVILHELVHTKVLKHDQRFWLHLSRLCPSYKGAIEWLRKMKQNFESRVRAVKKEYDFSKAEQGKFYRPVEELEIPIYPDKKIKAFYSKKALKSRQAAISPTRSSRTPS